MLEFLKSNIVFYAIKKTVILHCTFMRFFGVSHRGLEEEPHGLYS